MIYAGIGSRETPDEIQLLMNTIGFRLHLKGWTLRTGGAPGADMAFYNGALLSSGAGSIEVYLPWKGFQPKVDSDHVVCENPPLWAGQLAKQYHPAWHKLSQGARKLMARNSQQIFGEDRDISPRTDLIICWTEGGKLKGGTAQALRMAEWCDVPVYNLGDPLTGKLIADIIA